MSIPLPKRYCDDISTNATVTAYQRAPKKTGRGAAAMRPNGGNGTVGIKFPSPYNYMYFQEKGTKPHVMHELAGKTIPIMTPGGLIFRKATKENIGRRKITTRDAKGRIVTTKLSWYSPGIKPKRFAETSLRQETNLWAKSLTSQKAIQVLEDCQGIGPSITQIFKGN